MPSDTIAAAITASDSTPGTRKSTGCLKSVGIVVSTLAKNTRMPSGTASVTIRFSPRRSCSTSSARDCATSALGSSPASPRSAGPAAATGSGATASAVICRNTSSSERRPDCNDVSVASRSRRKHARSATRAGVHVARARRTPPAGLRSRRPCRGRAPSRARRRRARRRRRTRSRRRLAGASGLRR